MRLGLAVLVLLQAATPRLAPARRVTLAQAFHELCEGARAIPLQVAGSRHFVEVALSGPKGDGTLRFHVDTGGNTGGLLINRSAAARLGFDSEADLPKRLRLGKTDVTLPAGARWTIFDDSAEAKQAISGQITRKNFSEGQIGAGFLSRFTVCFDPAHGRMGLGESGAIMVDDEADWVPLIMIPGGPNKALYPFVFARIGRGGYGLLVDTGATTSMLETQVLVFQKGDHPDWPQATGAAGDADMIAGQFAELMLRVGSVKLSFPKNALSKVGLSAPPLIDLGSVLFVGRPEGTFYNMFGNLSYVGMPSGALAGNVLNRYRFILDYAHRRLWLERSGRPPDASASMVRVGVAIGFGVDGCPIVTQVTDTNAQPTRSEVRVGDVLLEVDGKDVCRIWHHEISAALAGSVGQMKALKLRRGRKVREVSVPVVDLLSAPTAPPQ